MSRDGARIQIAFMNTEVETFSVQHLPYRELTREPDVVSHLVGKVPRKTTYRDLSVTWKRVCKCRQMVNSRVAHVGLSEPS